MGKALDIAIAGAGIGGLASGAFLARAGHKVTLFDQFEKPRAVGSGLMLQETGLSVLAELGLRNQIDALGSKIARLWGLTGASGRAVLDVRYEKLRANLYGLGVQRSLLFEQLLQTAIQNGAELVGETQIAGADANTGKLHTSTGRTLGPFNLVIDSLGVRSPLTKQPRRALPYGALWATLPWPEDSPFDANALEQRYYRSSKMTGVMASGRTAPNQPVSLTYFWSIRADQEATWRKAPLEQWKQEAAALWPDTQILLDQMRDHDQLTFARYQHRTHPNPVSGPRLVHIGDAWHAASPQLGQGANMALLDAFALFKALDAKEDIADSLLAFKHMRQTHVRIYQLMTWLFTPVYQGDSRVLPLIRDWLASPLSRIWPAPQFLAGMVSGAIGAPLGKVGLKPSKL